MPDPIVTSLLAQGLAAAEQLAIQQAGTAVVTATTVGLEAQVHWRVAPWWDMTGVVTKPWSGPMGFGVRSTFKW